ncbi:DUF397 domain-containing protein [Streptomyces sp. NBC_01433]|uniref:DUF397 domain-containing protein n=1 Tax=Streptomyces sp. NBC_01433 TaxID=2903864 RepID=UPI002256FD8B|nr:DUF397 domain-containing protein [Streptomyces sp. NBC_01433]MCX4681446.1 DUF397 domain-containing protein [Streptomyces sp. NBC_01433]
MTTPNALMAPQIEGASWQKSSYSGSSEGQCIECAMNLVPSKGRVYIRDSKEPHGAALQFTPAAYRGFIDEVRGGRFDI